MAERLVADRDLVLQKLLDKEASAGLSEHDTETTRLLLYRMDPTLERASRIREHLLSEPHPSRFKSVARILSTSSCGETVTELRRIASSEETAPARRLRAVCGLAALDPKGVNLAGMGPALVRALQEEGIREIPSWLELLEPEKEQLTGCLARFCAEEAWDPGIRITAAEALAELLDRRRDAETLVRAMLEARPDAAAVLLTPLVRLGPGEASIGELEAELEEPGDHAPTPGPQERTRLQRRLTAATALWALGRVDRIWQVLGASREATLRETLIERLARMDFGRDRLLTRLSKEDINPSEREALLLIWNRTPDDLLTAQHRSEILLLAHRWFQQDFDPWVRAAAEKLVRTWSKRP